MDCSLPGSSIHGIFQARILEWVAISFSRRSSRPRDWTRVSCVVGRRFTIWATRNLFQKHAQMHIQKCFTSYLVIPCCSVTSSSTLCDPIDCSMPGFPVLHRFSEFAQTCPLSQWCHARISSSVVLFSSCPQSFPESGSFPMSWLFALGGWSIEASASVSVLPVNSRGWFPLELAGLISLLSKGLCRVFSSTTVQKHQFLGAQSSLWSRFHIHTWLLVKP